MLSQIVLLKVLAQDFKNVNFTDNRDCALARAGKRRFKQDSGIRELISEMEVERGNKKITYNHERFGQLEFEGFEEKAQGKPDDYVVLTIRMVKRD